MQPKFGSKIVTEVAAASDWYPADKGHQDYYNRNKSSNGYCRLVIHPKLSKVRRSHRVRVAVEAASRADQHPNETSPTRNRDFVLGKRRRLYQSLACLL